MDLNTVRYSFSFVTEMGMLKNCCCCCSVKIGCIVLGVLGIVRICGRMHCADDKQFILILLRVAVQIGVDHRYPVGVFRPDTDPHLICYGIVALTQR